MFYNGPNGRLCLFIINLFICFHKAYHDRLPDTLIDLILKKRAINYSTRTSASLTVPRFNTRYMKDSVAFRGSVLWNAVTNSCSTLTRNISYRDLILKLKTLMNLVLRQRLYPHVILEKMTLYTINLCLYLYLLGPLT